MQIDDILKEIESFSPSAAGIVRERKRQIDEEHFSADHDSHHLENELVLAAICYANPERRLVRKANGDNSYPNIPTVQKTAKDGTVETYMLFPASLWPFGLEDWKPTPDDRARELEKAAALLAAERDRIINIKTP